MTDIAALVWCPFPDADAAREVATRLLDEHLIACANILPRAESLFMWEGSVNSEQETPVVFKSTAGLLDRVIERIGQLHPYDTPAIIGWQCDAAHSATLTWLSAVTAGKSV